MATKEAAELDESHLLIGEAVSFNNGIHPQDQAGIVMGVVVMKFQQTDIFPTTGFSLMIDEVGTIKNVPYWQINGLIAPDSAYIDVLRKIGNTLRIKFPKYGKSDHPRWGEVISNGNDDMPF